jgi:hypothetical protein
VRADGDAEGVEAPLVAVQPATAKIDRRVAVTEAMKRYRRRDGTRTFATLERCDDIDGEVSTRAE